MVAQMKVAMKTKLNEICSVNSYEDKNDFVGILLKNKDNKIEPKIYFPLGFKLSSNEKELRTDIRLLIKTLAKALKEHNKSNYSLDTKKIDENNDFPLGAYIYILRDFFSRGYYSEFESTYKLGATGKINYARTIKTQKAYISDGEAYYLKFIARASEAKDALLIAEIHKYFVCQAYELVGWLFNVGFKPEIPNIKENKKLFKIVIKDKLAHTFNDKNRELFKNMLYILDNSNVSDIKDDFRYGTENFEYAWESLIDFTYGIDNKQDYFPKGLYCIDSKKYNSSILRPDTIAEFYDDIFILDAKYYKYGISKNPKDLPDTSSISKQVFYTEFAKNNHKDKEIFTAFILPFCGDEVLYKSVGYAKLENDNSDEKHKKIAVILVDTKFLMKQETKQNQAEIKNLSELIEKTIKSSIELI